MTFNHKKIDAKRGNDLAELGKANIEALIAIGFNLSQLDAADTAADEMANLLTTTNGYKADQNESKTNCEKVCTHLKELVDEVGNQKNND